MSLHSYSKCWLHLIWSTLGKEKIISNKEIQIKISKYLFEYSNSKNIFMRVNYVNPDHVHALIDLPTNYSIEEVMKLIKGSSSHWINDKRFTGSNFFWGRGYGVFSVSESNIPKVIKYIETQEEHHKMKTFASEYENFIKAYGLRYIKGEL
jgi:REP element-mobilizing transposase RayT